MFLDTPTLRDLEVVPSPTVRGTTLWSLIDRTRTRAGREALRQRLLAPPHVAEEIAALQRAHQALAAESIAYRAILDRTDLDGVEAYLNVTWQLPADMPGLSPVKRWYREYLQDVAVGLVRTRALLAAAADLQVRLAVADATILQGVSERIAALLENATLLELRELVSRQSASSSFDQLARGAAKSLLLDLLRIVGQLEALWSVGAATLEHGWSYPLPSSRLRVTGLAHPFLGLNAVRNDLVLNAGVRVCFVTGPNMAGKSTFLKAIALAVLLAQMGSGVPAKSMEWPTVGTVFASVQIADNVSTGESFYLAEVRRIKALAAAIADHGSAVAVIDEPFRGTNIHDATEATVEVITRLAAHPAALVFVASHVAEAVPAIFRDPRVALYHFAADVTGDDPEFDYRLREGVSNQRLGMTLLRKEAVLDLLERSAQSFDTSPDHGSRAAEKA